MLKMNRLAIAAFEANKAIEVTNSAIEKYSFVETTVFLKISRIAKIITNEKYVECPYESKGLAFKGNEDINLSSSKFFLFELKLTELTLIFKSS